ncbi:MAG TPA: M28 family peptidase [bacterium]|nr:M28 family peptidase [bacterium]
MRIKKEPTHVSVDLAPWFDQFLLPAADRGAMIVRILRARDVDARVLDLAGGRFVVAWPRHSVRDPRYRIKIVTAHHDRVPGTPGALDNSAACLQLVDFLSSEQDTFNLCAVFTDHEELHSSTTTSRTMSGAPLTGPSNQGSYALGQAFAGMGLRAPMVFTLDVTGRGDALVVSSAADGLMLEPGSRSAGTSGRGVSALAAETALMAGTVTRMMVGRAPVYRAMIPFGEDLGFLCAGIPALAITVLPRDEAESLVAGDGIPAWASPTAPGARMPDTWRRLHGPDDTPGLFTGEAFELVGKFLSRLAALRVPVAVGPDPRERS